jgi:hypothetical protein
MNPVQKPSMTEIGMARSKRFGTVGNVDIEQVQNAIDLAIKN